MKRFLFVLSLLALLVSIQLHAVHGRALEGNAVVPGRTGEGAADDEAVPVGADSANKSSSPKFKRMAFRLTSGPSRKEKMGMIVFEDVVISAKSPATYHFFSLSVSSSKKVRSSHHRCDVI
ncbi:hypothetical protein GQ457_07G025090 [Hibiscus cannabinus]